MIQLTHLGRRTGWNKADWLPVLAPSPVREPAHRVVSQGDRRTGTSSASSRDYAVGRAAHAGGRPRRHRVRSLRPSDGPASGRRPPTSATTSTAARSTTACASPAWCIDAVRAAVGPDFIVGIRMVADEDWDQGLSQRRRASRSPAAGQRPARSTSSTSSAAHIETDAALTQGHPDHRHALGAASRFRRRGAGRRPSFPVFHAARIPDVATARHAIADGQARHGRHDARPHRRSAYRREGDGAARSTRSAPASARPTASTASTRAARRCASTIAATGREATMPHSDRAGTTGQPKRVVVVGAGAGRPRGSAGCGRARPRGHRARGSRRGRRAGPAGHRRTRAARS